MQYVSTRGSAPAAGFAEVLLTGLAADGGLYVPAEWPKLPPETIAGLVGRRYQDVAFEVTRVFVGDDIAEADLRAMIEEAYAGFRHRAVTPVTQVAPNHYLAELFHGPTLAFKDVAMQLIARLMDHVLNRRGRRTTIVCATSGDTGGAAAEAFRGRDNADIFVLFPKGRVSPVQQRQMTTLGDANVHAIAVEGTFDDCQALVKALFNNHGFRDRLQLSGVNSINWARVMAQIVYYFTAALSLGAPARPVSFTVPTGNFGDIFAGYVAKRMGLPIRELVIATNVNDILARTLETGRYETGKVLPTSSPSMDIQVSSNFERLLFDAVGRDPEPVRSMMDRLKQSGGFEVPGESLAAIRGEFAAGRADEDETAATIAALFAESGYLLDPHTAVGVAVAERHMAEGVPMITLSTAHPAKFPDAVLAASGQAAPLPHWLGDLMQREEHLIVRPNDIGEIERTIESRSRAALTAAGQ